MKENQPRDFIKLPLRDNDLYIQDLQNGLSTAQLQLEKANITIQSLCATLQDMNATNNYLRRRNRELEDTITEMRYRYLQLSKRSGFWQQFFQLFRR